MFQIARKLLFRLPPERAHAVALRGLDLTAKARIGPFKPSRVDDPQTLMGVQFPNAVGLSAGMDKDGEHMAGLATAGFGFLELGTVTPMPQPGNPQPRVFRLVEHEALINRLGFNNRGAGNLVENLRKADTDLPLGINIGKNRTTPLESALEDYESCLSTVLPWADYVVVNLSSPNTPGLRDLQSGGAVGGLIRPLMARRDEFTATNKRRVPLLVKLAPDMNDRELDETVEALLECGIDGLTATNTTVDRSAVLGNVRADEEGGLSGRPLRDRATAVVARIRMLSGPDLPIIGVGGIMTADDAVEKIQAGANLVQLYTGFIYHGPRLIQGSAQAIRDVRRQ